MKYVSMFFGYLTGVILFLAGLPLLFDSPLAGLSLIAVSLLLLPPIRKVFYSKTNWKMPGKVRAASILVLFVMCGIFASQDQASEERELAARQVKIKTDLEAKTLQKNLAYFNLNKDQIISSLQIAFDAKEYQTILSKSKKYGSVGDKDLDNICAQARIKLKKIENDEKTKDILADLKLIPSSEYFKNRQLYGALIKLNPDNEKFQEKLNYYAEKDDTEKVIIQAAARKRKQEAERIRRESLAAQNRTKQIELQFSAWNGAHRSLEKVIKQSMNDPKSFEHVDTKYWDKSDYLIVKTTFRGRNGFGGMVINSITAKVSISGQVLEILAQE